MFLHYSVAQDLQALVKKLDSRVCALEKGGSDSKPAEAPKPAAEEDDDDDDFDPFGDDVSIACIPGGNLEHYFM